MRIMAYLLMLMVFFSVTVTSIEQVSARIKYKKYYNPRFDYTIKYPAKFVKAKYPDNLDGVWLWTKKKDAKLTMSGMLHHPELADDGYSLYENSYMKENRDKKDYSGNSGKDFAWQSYMEGNKIVYYYEFLTKEVDMSFLIEYPQSQRSYYDKVIKKMIKSIRKNTNPIPYRLYQ